MNAFAQEELTYLNRLDTKENTLVAPEQSL
jgi:hypothetical protein